MNNSEIWLTIEEVCKLTNTKNETIRRKCKSGIIPSKVSRNGKFKNYSIPLDFLSKDLQDKYIQEYLPKSTINTKNNDKNTYEEYSNAPAWAKKKAQVYLELFTLTKDLNYKETIEFINHWNNQYPDKKTSYSSLKEAQKKFQTGGHAALLAKYGHKNNAAVIDDKYFNYFKEVYLREGAPSAQNSWYIVFGYAKNCGETNLQEFPSCKSFMRRLKNEVPKQAIFMFRYGNASWNKKYAKYHSRSYENIKAGSFWVSDHAQIDVAVIFNGKVCFPWVTVFRDIKTSKWLGWFLHAESPNSDHIFQAFYYGVLNFGLPDDVYLDNGKDYRCKDFAGGRNVSKSDSIVPTRSSLITDLGINVHFALPYNAQTKPVERDFLKIKTFLSKGFVGYRGGNVVERPEKLKNEIKNNKIMQFEDFKTIFDDFIINVLNKKPSSGKILQNKSPDELWAEEFKVKNYISKDALKLFCMRTSKNVSIGRNGIYDSQLKITYWSEWMITEKGRLVYIRRDVNAYQEAWVFDAKTEEFLGKGNINHPTSFLATTDIEKVQLKEAIAEKKKEKKLLQAYLKTQFNPSNEEIVMNLKSAFENPELENNQIVSKIQHTKMDQVIATDKVLTENGLHFTSVPIKKPKKKLYLTEGERLRDMMKEAI